MNQAKSEKSEKTVSAMHRLDHVGARMRAVGIGRWAWRVMLGLAAVLFIVLIVSRMLGLIGDVLDWWMVLLTPVIAGLVGVLLAKKPKRDEAARQVDVAMDTGDLFLTAVKLDKSTGEYQPIVMADAEERAEGINAAQVVPWFWQKRTGYAALIMAVLVAGVLWLPQLDPFGKEQERELVVMQKEKLEQSRKAVEVRKAVLKKTDPTKENSEEVRAALDALKKSFKGFNREDRKGNLKTLGDHQQEIAKLWRKEQEEKLKNAELGAGVGQNFGAGNRETDKAAKKLAEKGDASDLKKKMEEVSKLAEEMAKTKDPAAKRDKAKQLEQKLKELSQAANKAIGDQGLQAAIDRAKEQMEMAQNGELSKEALEAIKESMELAQQEAENAAQQIRDIQDLEKALEAIQNAKAANQQGEGGLDGEKQPGEGDGIEDYNDLYKKMAENGQVPGEGEGQPGEGEGQAQGQPGQGQPGGEPGQPGQGGMGERGEGRGGIAEEDDSIKTKFKTERVNTHLTAGKNILEWKVRGVSDSGEVDKNYTDLVEKVREGVSEAIISEEVPPGYHDSIKNYFDTIDDSTDE